MKDMTQNTQREALRLMELLDRGMTIRFVNIAALARKKDGLIQVSTPDCTMRLSLEDFADLYGGFEAVPARPSEQIDEKKDEEYYAWRREKQ